MATENKSKALSGNQSVVLLIALAVVVWVVGLIVSKSIFDIITFNNEVISRKRSADSTLQDNIEVIDELQANFKELEGRGITTDRVLRALPDKYDIPALATRMEALLLSAGVSFESFGLDTLTTVATPNPAQTAPASNQGVQEIVFNVQIAGPYQNVKAALSNFEREINPMHLSQVKITGSEQNAQATFKIISYYQDHVSLDVKKETIQK